MRSVFHHDFGGFEVKILKLHYRVNPYKVTLTAPDGDKLSQRAPTLEAAIRLIDTMLSVLKSAKEQYVAAQ